jgi:hypothetical protein
VTWRDSRSTEADLPLPERCSLCLCDLDPDTNTVYRIDLDDVAGRGPGYMTFGEECVAKAIEVMKAAGMDTSKLDRIVYGERRW